MVTEAAEELLNFEDYLKHANDTDTRYERFNEVLIGPDGRLTLAGQRSNAQGGRFLLLNLDTGKAF